MAATRGGPAAVAACIIGGAEAGWCWSERCGGRDPFAPRYLPCCPGTELDTGYGYI